MRNPSLLLAAFGLLVTLASPAAAESDEGSCGARSMAAPAGPIDLEAIPMNEVAGPKAVQGAGDNDDEYDGIRASGKTRPPAEFKALMAPKATSKTRTKLSVDLRDPVRRCRRNERACHLSSRVVCPSPIVLEQPIGHPIAKPRPASRLVMRACKSLRRFR